jgi:hypothetical protein
MVPVGSTQVFFVEFSDTPLPDTVIYAETGYRRLEWWFANGDFTSTPYNDRVFMFPLGDDASLTFDDLALLLSTEQEAKSCFPTSFRIEPEQPILFVKCRPKNVAWQSNHPMYVL